MAQLLDVFVTMPNDLSLMQEPMYWKQRIKNRKFFSALKHVYPCTYTHGCAYTHTVILKINGNNTLLKYIEILGIPLDSTR